jgi:clan AA aspartic protease (TIGR02281 family)
MRAHLARFSWRAGLALSLCVTEAAVTRAQDARPADVLKGRDLKRAPGSTWALAAEAAALKDFRYARDLAARLGTARAQQPAIEMGDLNPKALIDAYRQQIDLLDRQTAAIDQELAHLGPSVGNATADNYHNLLVARRNSIVGEQRRLGALVTNLYDQKQQFQGQERQFDAEVARLREASRDAVDALRRSVDRALAGYAELRDTAEVTRALADLTTTTRARQKLGPTKELLAAIRWLEKAEGSVQSETVDLHREGGVARVDALLGGRGPVRMVFDTGAGPTTLPAGLAAALGLRPTGRTVACQVADGTTVLATEMIIPSVTVGRLSVKDVVCAVLPREKGDPAPLLGQSFLRHFDYKYVRGAGRLVLTRVKPDEPAARPGLDPPGNPRRPGRPPGTPGKGRGPTKGRR